MKRLTLFFLSACFTLGAFAQNLIVNGGFELPATGKILNINNVPGWHSNDVTSNDNGIEQNTGLSGQYREYSVNTALPIYQVIDKVTSDSAKYVVSYLSGISWNADAGNDTLYSVVYLSHYSSGNATSRTLIDSIATDITAESGKSLIKVSFKIPAGVSYVGDNLAVEFATRVYDHHSVNTNTWTAMDSVVVEKFTSYSLPIVNPGFELPATGKILNINNVPGWHSNDVTSNDNGIEQNTGLSGQYREYSVNTALPIYQVIDKVTSDSAKYVVSYLSGISWNADAGNDTIYSVIYLSHYSSGNATSRTLIDSIATDITAESGKSLIKVTFKIPAGVSYVGDNLAVEFASRVYDHHSVNTNTWTAMDSVVVIKTGVYNPPVANYTITTYKLPIVNPGFEFPDNGVKYLFINQIPGWKSDDTTSNDNGRESNTGLQGKYREYSVNTAKPIYQAIDFITNDSAEYDVSYLSGISWNADAGHDTLYSVVYFSHFSAGNIMSRTLIDSVATDITAESGKSTVKASLKIPAWVSYAGDSLAVEFATRVIDHHSANTNTWTAMDSVVVIKTGDSLPAPATINVSSITLAFSNKNDSVKIGASGTISVSILPLLASDQTIIWSLSDSSIVSVNTATGKLTGLKTGTVTVTVASVATPSVKGTIVIKVWVVPFNVETFVGDVPQGAVIVDTLSTKYLKIRLNGWNTAFAIVPLTFVKGEKVTFSYWYAQDTSSATSASVQAFIQFMQSTSAAEDLSITDKPASTKAKTITATLKADTVNQLQLAAQLTSGSWFAVAGPFLYISMMTFTQPVSVNSSTISSFEIYPNPATDYINLKNVNPNSKLFVYDVTGKLVLQSTITENTINIGSLYSGLYMIQVRDGNNTYYGKLIKK